MPRSRGTIVYAHPPATSPTALSGAQPAVTHYEQQKRDEALAASASIIQLFKQINEGVPPTNKQILSFIDRTEVGLKHTESQPLDGGKMPKKSRRVISDTTEFLEATKNLITSKNNDQIIQDLIVNSGVAASNARRRHAGESVASELKTDRGMIKKTSKTSYELVSLIVGSAEFRQLVMDLLNLVDKAFIASAGGGGGGEEKLSMGKPLMDSIRREKSLAAGARETAANVKHAFNTFIKQGTGAAPSADMPTSTTEITSKLPPESVAQLREQFEAFLTKLASNEKYKRGIEDLFALIGSLKKDMMLTTSTATRVGGGVKSDTQASKAMREAKDFLERFLHGRTIDELLRHLRIVMSTVKKDKPLNAHIKSIRRYATRALNQPELLKDENFRQEGSTLLSNSRGTIHHYSNNDSMKAVLKESRDMLNEIAHDRELKQWSKALTKVLRDFTYADTTGKRHLDISVMDQLRRAIVPIIAEQLKYIAIPTIRGSDPTYDWSVSRIVFSGYDILPEYVHVDTDFRWLSKLKSNFTGTNYNALGAPSATRARLVPIGAEGSLKKRHTRNRRFRQRRFYPGMAKHRGLGLEDDTGGRLVVELHNIRAQMRDITFNFTRKKFPRITDSGLASVEMLGRYGMRIRLVFDVNTTKRNTPFVTGGHVKVEIDKLKIKIAQSKHNALYNTATTLFRAAVRKRVERAVSDAISRQLETITGTVNSLVAKIPTDTMKNTMSRRIRAFLP